MEYYDNMQCRSTFFNLLAYGYKTFEGVASDMEMTTENFKLLQGLVFNDLCEN